MNQNTKSLISGIFLIFLFLISLYMTSIKDEIKLCKDNNVCIFEIAKETKNFNYCNNSLDSLNCYKDLAIYFNISSLCKNTIDEDYCYTSVAINTQNVSICNQTSNFNQCVFDMAIYESNYNYCYDLVDSNMCLYSYAVQKKDSSLCDLSIEYNLTCKEKIKLTMS